MRRRGSWRPSAPTSFSRGATPTSTQLLRRADIVSLHVPLTAETHHLLDARRLRSMKKTAVLINTARGPVVDEAALAEALRDGTIAGAGLDVYEREPEVTEALLGLENVVLAPHLGSATRDTRVAMGMLCVTALARRPARGPHTGQRRRLAFAGMPGYGSQAMWGDLERVLVRPPLPEDRGPRRALRLAWRPRSRRLRPPSTRSCARCSRRPAPR